MSDTHHQVGKIADMSTYHIHSLSHLSQTPTYTIKFTFGQHQCHDQSHVCVRGDSF